MNKAVKTILIILVVIAILAGIAFLLYFNEYKWKDAKLTSYGDRYLTWSSDGKTKSYEVYVDGALLSEVNHAYIDISDLKAGTHTVKVVKRTFLSLFFKCASEISIKKSLEPKKEITHTDELEDFLTASNKYSVGSLMYEKLTIDLTYFSDTTATFAYPLSITSSLKCLEIIGNPSLILNKLRINIEDRTEPLTIVLVDANVATSADYIMTAPSSSNFDVNLLLLGKCSLSNTKTGATGSNGANANGFPNVSGRGGNGGNGGGIFSIPHLKLFTESTPQFMTGNGGNGGAGGNGSNMARGGAGGNGGNGGFVFNGGKILCFNAECVELTGSYGSGGTGGLPGHDSLGSYVKGSNGASGGLYTSGTELVYLSTTGGIENEETDDEEDEVGSFNVSYSNGLIVWNNQGDGYSYEVLADGEVIADTTQNAFAISSYNGFGNAKIKVRATKDKDVKYSHALKIYDTPSKNFTSQPLNTTLSISGAEYIEITSNHIGQYKTISVGADVKRLSIIGNSSQRELIRANIVADSRTDNLILDLVNVYLASSGTDGVVLNGGAGTSSASDAMLVINAPNGAISGANGSPGTDGGYTDSLFAVGTNGTAGSRGYSAIKASVVVVMGDYLAVYGGNGGNGGRGGDTSGTNNAGNGGNGGKGGDGIVCNTCYVVMNSSNSTLALHAGSGGQGGAAGTMHGILGGLNSADNGHNGNSGSTCTGTIVSIVGNVTK